MDFAGLEKLSLVDYDHHIACTLFTKGCNFRCPFCHNSPLVTDLSNTDEIPWNEIMIFLRRRQGLLDGVVISGGEPTLMPDLKEKLKDIKSLGYSIKLDTNGTNPQVIIDLVASGLVDYVAMDIKASFITYPAITNSIVNIEKIKESINYLLGNHVDYEFRTTLINEFHDAEDIKRIALEIKGCKKYRLQKFINAENCISHNLHEVDVETAKSFIEILKNHIDDVALRGYDI